MKSNPVPELDSATQRWLREIVGGAAPECIRLVGDLSPRKYWRLCGSGLLLARHPESDLPSLRRFLRTSTILADAGVRVPRVVASHEGLGAILVEDFGSVMVYDLPTGDPQLELRLEQAAEACGRIRRLELPGGSGLLGPLDHPSLLAEVAKSIDVALVALGYLEARRRGDLLTVADDLCRQISQRLEPAHRDFMVRNLVPLPEHVGVLDHQDLRLAPAGYDLASLLLDSVALPGRSRAALEGTLVPAEMRPQWAAVGAQRCLKIVGTFVGFAGLGVRRHLRLVPGTLAALARIAPEVPLLAPWVPDFEAWAARATADPALVV